LAKEQKFFGASRGLGPRASRRCLLQAGLTIGTLALGQRAALGQSGGAHVHMPELGVTKLPVVPAMDQPLVEPEVRRSVNGVLSTSLRCAYAYRDIGGKRLYLRSYEGRSPGPTLRMKPGETLKIRLTNDFPPNRDLVPQDLSRPHQFNNTNFHFHGAHCSPSGIADNVMRSMVPGKAYDIEIALPADHTRGTYWYHPHHHGSADVQVASGMAGAIIVEGDFADVPEIARARERVMLLTQVVFDAFGMVEGFVTLFPETSTRFLAINGQRRPTIDMRPGEVQRWRLVGSQYQDDMLLELDKHRLNVIAYDGIQLGTLQEMKQLLIAPGQRADVLVQAGSPGTYELNAIHSSHLPLPVVAGGPGTYEPNAMPFDQGHPSPTGPLARVVVAGEPLPMKLPAALPKPPLETIRDSEITGRRTVVLSTIGDPPENDPGGQWQEFTFMVDCKTFDPSRIDQRVRLGAVEEWTIRNKDLLDDHAFHIHTNPFQVTQVNGQPQADLQWRDTVVVPRQGVSVVLRSRFLDYTGVFMMHCHMMNHEEMGMMQAVEVYKE
jgi:FtsP/CotA-like multicopper oxidase with cupredoxin domain